jgi:O-antigen ligase
MLEYAIIIAAQIAVLGAVVILREPKLLIPAVVLGLPMEYLETETIHSLGSSGLAGAARSLLNPGQAAMAATVIVGVIRARHEPSRLIPDSAMMLPILLLVGIQFLGVAWSDSLVPANSILILPLYLGFVFVAPSFIEDRRDIERIVGAFLVAAILLATLSALQRLTGVFNWRDILIQSDNFSYRSNATFADPNNLARFLAVAMSLGGGLILATGPRRQTVYLAVPALAAGAIGIVATASRSGWLMLMLCSFLVVIMSPIARYTKLRLTAVSATGVVVLLGLLLVQGGSDAERVKSLSSAVSVLGQRSFLINAGWHMFKENPIAGVGSGNYQHSLVTTYLDLVPDWARTTLSHTSLISLIAELGVIGAALFAFFLLRIAVTLVQMYRSAELPYTRLIVGWLSSSLIGILLISQSEGRLFDEPYLWVLFAITIAVETSPSLAGRAVVAGSTPESVVQVGRGASRRHRTPAGAAALFTANPERTST